MIVDAVIILVVAFGALALVVAVPSFIAWCWETYHDPNPLPCEEDSWRSQSTPE